MAARHLQADDAAGAPPVGDRPSGPSGLGGGSFAGRGVSGRAAEIASEWASAERTGQIHPEHHVRARDYRGRGPRGYRRSDQRILEDVSDRLTDDAWIDASGIEVQVEQGEVTLDGRVDTRSARRRAEDLAATVPGVIHVQNNLRVRPPQL